MKRRRKRSRRNPPSEANTILTWGVISGLAATVLGAPKVGGALLVGAGTYAMLEGDKKQQVIGGFYDVFGLIVAFT